MVAGHFCSSEITLQLDNLGGYLLRHLLEK